MVEFSAVFPHSRILGGGIVYHDPRRNTNREIAMAYAFAFVRLRELGGLLSYRQEYLYLYLPNVAAGGLFELCDLVGIRKHV